jgi:helix-turn-helix protein
VSAPAPPRLKTVLTLDELARDPTLFDSLSPALQDDTYLQVVTLAITLRVKRDASRQATSPTHGTSSDELLDIAEAARRLKTSADSLYRKWGKLPFAYKDPIDGKLKFRAKGIDAYIERRARA